MSKYIKANIVLTRAREELIGEIVRTGESGGSGLAQRFAPILVNLQQAIEVVTALETRVSGSQEKMDKPMAAPSEVSFAEKMKIAKAAKKLSAVV